MFQDIRLATGLLEILIRDLAMQNQITSLTGFALKIRRSN